jgi:energy-coupling factor transport system permease protein
MSAQKARGADFTSGSLINRAKALVPILIPLFVSAFRRASELAVAMECRCYRGGAGRTRMKRFKIGAADVILLVIIAIGIAAIVIFNVYLPVMKV